MNLSKKRVERQSTVTVEEQKQMTDKLESRLKTVEIKEVQQVTEKKSLRGTYELKLTYHVGSVAVSVSARHHTLSAKDVEDKVKKLVIWRDAEGKRVVYRQTPFRFGYFHADETTGDFIYKKMTLDEIRKAVEASAQLPEAETDVDEEPSENPLKDKAFILPIVIINGETYTVSEADSNTCKPYTTANGKEQQIEQFEKTKEIIITEDELRPSVTYDGWLIERSKEIFAVDTEDQRGLWLVCQDMNNRDAVAVVQTFVEKKGLTTYHLIVKPVYYADKGQFMLMGAVVRKPFVLEWLMNVPMETIKQIARKTVDLLTKVTGTSI
jgi:hypothetical protein